MFEAPVLELRRLRPHPLVQGCVYVTMVVVLPAGSNAILVN